ncbi:BZ3500_MvSof-1268-A1-R1_Chr3-1g05814 [Microbotryum saponariae]|uniref:BZ3500_MvSof-1268-A1-R1_Chr3-1g05814 protein n=1 Tax=Microbotryum saponariae TaxID=289078 RepID=A0A2X0LDG5_9BASI|nr:BZ3500_MvSof-1268-A1-R1_Chr3-1g05814 [Microbotryum saponariae]SDA05004.1 BZ3501_MvSof-1269-A2-R1_Chr3-1g05484 [Microbotryum saponariae]
MAPPTLVDEELSCTAHLVLLDDLDDIVTAGAPTAKPTTTTTTTSTIDDERDFPDPEEALALPSDSTLPFGLGAAGAGSEGDAALAAEMEKNMSSLFAGLGPGEEEEFKKMMQQLMSGQGLDALGFGDDDGAGGAQGSAGPDGDDTELLSQLMAAMGAGAAGLATSEASQPDPTTKGKATQAFSTTTTSTPSSTQPTAPVNFQDAIKASMSKVQQSNSAVDQETSAKTAAGANADPLAAMMASMAGLEGGEEGLQGMLDEMMGQLMSREVLYEPLKELSDKYPTYLSTNEGKLPSEDLKRFQIQATVVSQIVSKFEEPGADKAEDQMTPSEKERNTQRRQEITDLIAQMNDCGAPPKEIMGEMPPGMELGADGVPKMPEDCIIS